MLWTCLGVAARFQEAEKLHTDVCKKMEAQFGAEHGDVTSSKFNLVTWLAYVRKLAQIGC